MNTFTTVIDSIFHNSVINIFVVVDDDVLLFKKQS